MSAQVKLVVYVPVTHSEIVRTAMGEVGGGSIGNYDHCSFTIRGMGRFLGNDQSNPTIGSKGTLEAVEEDRIEMTVERTILSRVIAAMKSVHPYEEIAFDIYSLETQP